MSVLQIQDSRERTVVRVADAALAVAAGLKRPFVQRPPASPPRRILLLRLERIGDLVMTWPRSDDVRALAPDAEIDLVVGSWNSALAAAIPVVDRVVSLDAAWLAREGRGLVSPRSCALPALARPPLRSRHQLRTRRPQQPACRCQRGRSNGRVGRAAAAGRCWISRSTTTRTAHTAATPGGSSASVRPNPSGLGPAAARDSRRRDAAAGAILAEAVGRPLVGVHVNGGRAIKQWEPDAIRRSRARG